MSVGGGLNAKAAWVPDHPALAQGGTRRGLSLEPGRSQFSLRGGFGARRSGWIVCRYMYWRIALLCALYLMARDASAQPVRFYTLPDYECKRQMFDQLRVNSVRMSDFVTVVVEGSGYQGRQSLPDCFPIGQGRAGGESRMLANVVVEATFHFEHKVRVECELEKKRRASGFHDGDYVVTGYFERCYEDRNSAEGFLSISFFSNGTCVIHPGAALQLEIKEGSRFDITSPASAVFILDEPSVEHDASESVDRPVVACC